MGQQSVMRFVMYWFLLESETMSVVAFQHRSKSPMALLGLLVLSCLVASLSCLMFVDHDLRLNLAWFTRSLDCE